MIFFKFKTSFNEIKAVQKHLNERTYCFIQLPGDDFHYGVIGEECFEKLLDVLSGETLEKLEYLDEPEFKKAIPFWGETNSTNSSCEGNTDLIRNL
jgi:hypothetical protein